MEFSNKSYYFINVIIKMNLINLVKESIEIYNKKRPHLSLGMKTPNFIHKKRSWNNPAPLE